MYKKLRQYNDLFLIFLEYKEPITRNLKVIGPLVPDRSLVPCANREASTKGLISLPGSTVDLCLQFLHIYVEIRCVKMF